MHASPAHLGKLFRKLHVKISDCHFSVTYVSSNYEQYCCCLSFTLQEESGFTLNLAFTNVEF